MESKTIFENNFVQNYEYSNSKCIKQGVNFRNFQVGVSLLISFQKKQMILLINANKHIHSK
jgi:hypothetical protein